VCFYYFSGSSCILGVRHKLLERRLAEETWDLVGIRVDLEPVVDPDDALLGPDDPGQVDFALTAPLLRHLRAAQTQFRAVQAQRHRLGERDVRVLQREHEALARLLLLPLPLPQLRHPDLPSLPHLRAAQRHRAAHRLPLRLQLRGEAVFLRAH